MFTASFAVANIPAANAAAVAMCVIGGVANATEAALG